MEIHLKASGIALILLAFLHSIFPKYFNWKKELKGLSLVNRQMMQIHTFFIALTDAIVEPLANAVWYFFLDKFWASKVKN